MMSSAVGATSIQETEDLLVKQYQRPNYRFKEQMSSEYKSNIRKGECNFLKNEEAFL